MRTLERVLSLVFLKKNLSKKHYINLNEDASLSLKSFNVLPKKHFFKYKIYNKMCLVELIRLKNLEIN